MAKKFDIHEWQAKYWLKNQLTEAEEFTPDLEDDELKRSKIQQMMGKEKSKTPQDVERGTLNNAIADLAEMYSYGEILDALKVFYTDNDELPFADMAKKHAKEFRDFLDNAQLDEQNTTGTGASFNAGDGAGYATPNAFANDEDDWENKNMVYEDEELPPPPTDDEGNPTDPEAVPQDQTEKEIIDTAKELGQQLKAFGKEVTTPKGGKGFDSGEIEVFSDLLIQLKDAIKNGNASSLLGRIKNLLR
jgi:hypothetical protein